MDPAPARSIALHRDADRHLGGFYSGKVRQPVCIGLAFNLLLFLRGCLLLPINERDNSARNGNIAFGVGDLETEPLNRF